MLSQIRLTNAATKVVHTPWKRLQYTAATSRSTQQHGGKWMRRYKNQTGTIFVRPWDGISSMVEGLALIRGLERRYGEIQEYQLMRDPDHVEVFVPFFWVTFKDRSIVDRLPSQPHVVQIRVPKFDRARPGGVSLDELREYILPEDKVDDIANPPGVMARMAADVTGEDTSDIAEDATRVIDVRIEIADNKSRYKLGEEFAGMGKGRIHQIGKAFTAWGGFYEPHTTPEDVSENTEPGASPQTPPLSYMAVAQKTWDERLHEPAKTLEPEVAMENEEPQPTEVTAEHDAPVELEAQVVESTSLPLEADSMTTTADPMPPLPSVAEMATAPAEFVSSTEHQSPPPTKSKALSRKEQLLAKAREVARAEYPPNIAEPIAEQRAQKDEEKVRKATIEREKMEAEHFMDTVRGRLKNIMGGRWY